MTLREELKVEPGEYYVDVMFRIRIKCEGDLDPTDAVNEFRWEFDPPDDCTIIDSEMKEVKTAGLVEQTTEALIRPDGGSGQNARIVHFS